MQVSGFAKLAVALLVCSVPAAQQARYRLTVDNTWSETTHPGAFPAQAHFSWVGGGLHDAGISFWDVGVLASPGMVFMAETGDTSLLEQEVDAAVGGGSVSNSLGWHHWFCPADTADPQCGSMVVEFEVLDTHPLATLVTMLGPSPDWFVGVSGLPLRDASGWLESVFVDLRPYDGGTRDNNVFELFGPLTTPPDPITLITEASGQIIGPDSLGSFTFERILPALFADAASISLAAGGFQSFSLDAGSGHAGKQYWLVGSASGTSPGYAGPPFVPLNIDWYSMVSILNPNQPPFFNSLGTLDGAGTASAAVGVPAGFDPSLAGLHLDHAFVVFDALSGAGLAASNALGLDLLP